MRIVIAIFFTLGSMGGMGAVLNPDETMSETRLGNFEILITLSSVAVNPWLLYFANRERKSAAVSDKTAPIVRCCAP